MTLKQTKIGDDKILYSDSEKHDKFFYKVLNIEIFWLFLIIPLSYRFKDPERYSFSGNPVVSAKISKTDVKNVILFAPLLFLNKKEVLGYLQDEKVINNFYGFNLFYLEFLRRGYGFAFRGIEKQSWDKYFSGEDAKSFIEMNNNYPNILIFHGKSDEKINCTSSTFFQKEKYSRAKVFLVENVGHDLEKLFDIDQINKLI